MSRKQKSHEQVHFGSPLVIGVDVHKNSYAVAILDEDGRSVVFSMPADNKAFVSKICSLSQPVKVVAYEAGPCGYSLHRTCKAADINSLVAASSRIPRPATRANKTDRLDCHKLGEYAARTC